MAFAIVMLVFASFAAAIAWRPATIIAFAFCVYAFEQWAQAHSSYFGSHAAFINFGFGLLTLWALVCVVLRGDNPLNPTTAAMWTWAALFIFAGVSCLWSIDRNLSIFLFKYHFPYMITFVGLVPLSIQRSEDLYKSLLATLCFGSLVMILLLLSTRIHAWGRTIEVEQGAAIVDRVGGLRTRLAPLAIAEMAGQLLIIAVLMNFRGIHKVWQYLRWGVAFLAMALIYRSGSRGQLIAALLAIMMFITFSRGTKRAIGWITAGISTAMIFGFAIWSFVGFADQSGRWDLDKMQNQFTTTRLDYVTTLLNFWIESSPINWLFGLGSSASYDPRILGRYCHVVIVEVLAELGFVGLLIMVAFIFFVARDALRLYQTTKDNEIDRGVAVTMSAIFMYQVILSFKQGSLLSHNFSLCCGLLIARHSAVTQMAYRRERVRDLQRRWYTYYARLAQATSTLGRTSPQN